MINEPNTFANSERVELVWPNKLAVVRVFQEDDGRWNIGTDSSRASLRGLTDLSHFPEFVGGATSLLISGQRHDALNVLRHGLGPIFRLIYFDLPRLDVDDVTNAFEAVSPLRLTTWLSLVRAMLIEARELLSRQGVLAVHCGEEESQYAKLIIDELFRDKRIGTVVWQKAYSGQNMKGMKEFTDTHDLIYLYSRDKDALPPVGLRRPPEGYANPDGDPRGPWKAEHKGARTRRDNSDFDTYQPPYRWEVIDGSLPPGIWRVSPFSGVIWGMPSTPGEYKFTVRVTDKDGSAAQKTLRLDVAETGVSAPPPGIPWAFEEIKTSGRLRIETESLPNAITGQSYSAAVVAAGGKPFLGNPIRPGSGRYWDFAKATLVAAYQNDNVYFGSREPTSIPTPKKYEPPAGVLEIENQQSIWLGRTREAGSKATEAFAGFTEDATKHLKALKQVGLIQSEAGTAKPEKLMARFIEIFTDRNDFVLEVMSSTADLAATALKLGRKFVALQGSSPRELGITRGCALPRLKAVIAGEDRDLEVRAPMIKLSHGAYIPFAGSGSFTSATVGPELAVLLAEDDRATLAKAVSSMSEDELTASILTAEGYIPPQPGQRFASGIDGQGRALVVPPSQFLTPELASEIASDSEDRPELQSTTIYYFRSIEDIAEETFGGRVAFRRIPFDILRLDVE